MNRQFSGEPTEELFAAEISDSGLSAELVEQAVAAARAVLHAAGARAAVDLIGLRALRDGESSSGCCRWEADCTWEPTRDGSPPRRVCINWRCVKPC